MSLRSPWLCRTSLRVLTPLVAVFAALLAGEAPAVPGAAPDPRAELKSLWTESLRRSDLWTALQCEAYARQRRLPPIGTVLGPSEVLGDPLLACPEEIVDHWDRGEWIGVITARRYYRFAPDGRPLMPSVEMPISLDRGAESSDGRIIGGVDLTAAQQVVFECQVVGGAPILRQSMPVALGDALQGGMAMADDGSAAVVGVRHNLLGGPRLLIARADGRNETVPDLHGAEAIGPRGAWHVAMLEGGRQRVLTHGGKAQPIRSFASGPRCVAFIDAESTLHLITPAGDIVAMPPAMGIGADGLVATHGRWLVVASGHAKTMESRDLGDQVIPGGDPQPPSLALYRWDDLIAQPGSPPERIIVNAYQPQRLESAGVLLWRGRVVEWLDLSGHEAVVRPLATVPGKRVERVAEDSHRIRIRYDGDRWLVLARDGRELWSGTGDDCSLSSRDWALVRQGGAYDVIRLATDPAKRTAARLQIDPGPWSIQLDRLGRRAIAIRSPGPWHELDMASGKVLRSGGDHDPATPRPAVLGDHRPGDGRFWRHHGRLFDKGPGEDGKPLGQAWHPTDAWRVGGALVVLGRDQQVFVSRRRGDWLGLGRIDAPRAGPFGVRNRGELVVFGDDERVVAGFAPGPSLVALNGATADHLPPGPWRVDGSTFAPPGGGGQMRTSADAIGFEPRRLRSPDVNGLLMITASVIIDLDARAARVIARP